MLEEVCCACVPVTALAGLARLRVQAELRVRILGERAWLWWNARNEGVAQRVLALRGVQVFSKREGRWYRPGQHLPAFEVADDEAARPLLHVLTPEPVRPEYGIPSLVPLTLRLTRDNRLRTASTLCCSLIDLANWAERATSKQLGLLTALRADERVLVRGARLPPLTVGERYWGRTVLTPLGLQPEPEASEGVLRQALRLQDEEIALLGGSGFEAIDARRFQPLTRASLRLGIREGR